MNLIAWSILIAWLSQPGQWGLSVSFCTRLISWFPAGLRGLEFWGFMGIFARLLGSFFIWIVLLALGGFRG